MFRLRIGRTGLPTRAAGPFAYGITRMTKSAAEHLEILTLRVPKELIERMDAAAQHELLSRSAHVRLQELRRGQKGNN
jgi:hypothetical protein